MWVPLTDENLIEIYKKNFVSEKKVPKRIISLLEQLQKKSYADKLAAVTSLGHLRLTTALSYVSVNEESKHGCINVSESIDAGKPVINLSFTAGMERQASAWQRCAPEEAADYIDLYVMRLLLEKYDKL
jgi:hypothetical protein